MDLLFRLDIAKKRLQDLLVFFGHAYTIKLHLSILLLEPIFLDSVF